MFLAYRLFLLFFFEQNYKVALDFVRSVFSNPFKWRCGQRHFAFADTEYYTTGPWLRCSTMTEYRMLGCKSQFKPLAHVSLSIATVSFLPGVSVAQAIADHCIKKEKWECFFAVFLSETFHQRTSRFLKN